MGFLTPLFRGLWVLQGCACDSAIGLGPATPMLSPWAPWGVVHRSHCPRPEPKIFVWCRVLLFSGRMSHGLCIEFSVYLVGNLSRAWQFSNIFLCDLTRRQTLVLACVGLGSHQNGAIRWGTVYHRLDFVGQTCSTTFFQTIWIGLWMTYLQQGM